MPPPNDRTRPPGTGASSGSSLDGATHIVDQGTDYWIEPRDGQPYLVVPLAKLTQTDRRWIESMVDQASASHWLRRAEAFQAAVPSSDEFLGIAPNPDARQRERARRCHAQALACRRQAALLAGTLDQVVTEALAAAEEEPLDLVAELQAMGTAA